MTEKGKSLSAPILAFLPAIALIPVLSEIFKEVHGGGLHLLGKFALASFQPSLDPLIIQHAFRGLQITIATALISWTISMCAGSLLGVLSSNVFWRSYRNLGWLSSVFNSLISIPRSIHELVWGLLLLQLFGLNPWVAIVAICIPYSALVARVLRDQLESLDHRPMVAITKNGASPISAFFTALMPAMVPIMTTYGSYRLECALRGATLLGVFGLGGIGTELQLTLQSLEFNEMWTSLWMLGVLMFGLEKTMAQIRKRQAKSINLQKFLLPGLFIIMGLFILCFLWLQILEVDILSTLRMHPITLPQSKELIKAIYSFKYFELIFNTLLIMVLATGIAVGLPPVMLILFPTKKWVTALNILWSFLRLIPPPLSALLLLLITTPSVSVAALALGIHNLGIMGRLLKEGLESQNNAQHQAMLSAGAGMRGAWLYGLFSKQSKSYLAYGAYRADVIVRETSVVGVIGGVGLGWQLQESLSSFGWSEVIVIIAIYIFITRGVETVSNNIRKTLLIDPTKTQINNVFQPNRFVFQ